MIPVSLNITKITVYHGSMRDNITIEFDNIPHPIPDCKDSFNMSFSARCGEGTEFVLTNFGISKSEVNIICLPSEQNHKITEINPKKISIPLSSKIKQRHSILLGNQ